MRSNQTFVTASSRANARFSSLLTVPDVMGRTLGIVFLLASLTGLVTMVVSGEVGAVGPAFVVGLTSVAAGIGIALYRGALDGRSNAWVSAAFGIGTVLVTLGGVIADKDGVAFRYFYLWPIPMIVGSLPRAHIWAHLTLMAVGGAVVPLVQSESSFADQAGSWVAATASIAFAAAASHGVLASVVSLEGRVGRAFSESPIGMALLSSGGEFLDVNAELATMLRRDRDEILGMHVSQTTHPDHVAHLQDVAAKTFENPG
ncbi:MAG: PAS domain-containing protein, partial [Acidimicrobiales bacterium]|nr:PAS domain-containing protein [Acidimicrobiales bacterium]